MKIRQATESDNKALIDFYSSLPIKGRLLYFIKKKIDFFSLYRMQSKEYVTFILIDDAKDEKDEKFDPPPVKNQNQKIYGCASFIIKNAALGGEIVRVAWATDLRISTDRKAIIEWGKHFLPLLAQLKETHKIKYFFSALNLADTQLLNTFIRIRNPKRQMPRYHLFRKFSLVSVHGRYPWAKEPISSLEISRGRTNDYADLTNYLHKKCEKMVLNTDWRVSTLFEKLRLWKGVSIEQFWIARHKTTNEIVGCVLPWSPDTVQEYIPIEYSRVAENFRQFLKFGNLFGITRRLTKSVKRTGLEQAMPLSFLTHFFCDNEDIMESLLQKAWESQGPEDFLIYTYFKNDRHMKPPPTWINVENHFGVYCMLSPDEILPEFLSPYHNQSVEIDPQFV